MNLKRFFIIGLLVSVFTIYTNAQGYETGLGLRLGYDNGITLKNFFAKSNATEFILSASPHYFQLTGLYEYQEPLPNANNFYWYVGIGAHIGNIYNKKNESNNRLLLGVDLIGGLEYVFPQAPFTVSLDWKPAFNFTNDYNDNWYYPLALSLRYSLK